MTDSVLAVFDAIDNVTRVRPFDHAKRCGLVVEWSERGTGWGMLTICCDKATGEWKVDTETMGPEWIGQMLMRLKDTPRPIV